MDAFNNFLTYKTLDLACFQVLSVVVSLTSLTFGVSLTSLTLAVYNHMVRFNDIDAITKRVNQPFKVSSFMIYMAWST